MRISNKRFRSRKEEIQGLLHAINEETINLPAPVLRKLAPVFVQAEKELIAGLQRWAGTVDGEEPFTAFQMRRALTQLQGAFDAIKKTQPELYRELKGGAVVAGDAAKNHLVRELTILSFRFEGSITPVPILPAAKIMTKTLMDKYSKQSKRWSDEARDNIRRNLAIGLVKGDTIDQLATRLMGPATIGADADLHSKMETAGSRLWAKSRGEAERIVRTEVISAYNDQKVDLIYALQREDPRYGRRWDGAIDGRLCLDCREMDGQIASGKEPFKGDIEAPPLHPNCRCAVVVWRSDWEEQGTIKRPGPEPDEASL